MVEKNQPNEKNGSISPVKSDIFLEREQLFDLLKNEMDLEILLLLFMHHELNLSQLAEIFNKSKATLSRHVKKMVESGIVQFRVEKVRGVEAKFFYSDFKKFLNLKTYSVEDMQHLSKSEFGRKQIGNIRDMLLSLLIFGKKTLTDVSEFLQNLTTESDAKLVDFFSQPPPFSYSVNFLSENQYNKYNAIQQEFCLKVWEMMQEETESTSDKPYFVINGVFPHKSFVSKWNQKKK